MHGGVAQGIAEALYEEALYDEHGNLMSSSMTQYLVPSADGDARSSSIGR